MSTTLLLGLELISDIGARAQTEWCAATACAAGCNPRIGGCNPMRRRLQSHAFEAATACT